MARSERIPQMEVGFMKEKFELIFSDAEEDTKSCWETILRFIVKHAPYIKRRDQIQYISKYLITKLLTHGCNDADIVSRIIKMYHRYILSGIQKEEDSSPVASCKINVLVAPLNLKLVNRDDAFCDEWKLLLAVDQGDLVYTKLLLKYGLFSDSKNFYLTDIPRGMNSLMDILHYVKAEVFNQEPDSASCYREAKALLDKSMQENGKLVANQRGYQRLFLLLRTLDTVIGKRVDHPYTENFVQCIKLYLTTVTEPFFSQDEVRELLHYLFNKEDNYQEMLEEFIQIYTELYHPVSAFPYRPRSLKQLARCAARKYLQRSSPAESLPVIVNKENLPQTVKELLFGALEHSP